MKKHTRHAFSMVELAIVIAIIGLLSGGILAGQSLVDSARLQKTLRQLEEVETSASAFRSKYNFLPGDLPNPELVFPTPYLHATRVLPGHGNGNGMIEGLSSAGSITTSLASAGEPTVFFHQLADAGYIAEKMTYLDLNPGTYTLDAATTNTGMFLPAALGNNAMIAPFSNATHNYLLVVGPATGPAVAGAVVASAAMNPLQALGIDTKRDDGGPATGAILSVSPTTPSPALANGRPLATPVEEGVDCFDTTSSAYISKFSEKSCTLSIRAAF